MKFKVGDQVLVDYPGAGHRPFKILEEIDYHPANIAIEPIYKLEDLAAYLLTGSGHLRDGDSAWIVESYLTLWKESKPKPPVKHGWLTYEGVGK